MTHGYTVAQTARLVSAMRWVLRSVVDITDAWAHDACANESKESKESEESEAAVWLAVLSRRLASHCESFEMLQPDSVRMLPYRDAVAPDPRLPSLLDEIAELSGITARLAVVQRLLIPCLVDACDEIRTHSAPHCDAALAWTADAMGLDLARHRLAADGEVSSTVGVSDTITQALAQAGGLVPHRLLRPES